VQCLFPLLMDFLMAFFALAGADVVCTLLGGRRSRRGDGDAKQ